MQILTKTLTGMQVFPNPIPNRMTCTMCVNNLTCIIATYSTVRLQTSRSHNANVVPVLFVKKNKAHIDTSCDIRVACDMVSESTKMR